MPLELLTKLMEPRGPGTAVYPPDLFQTRLKEEILRSNRNGTPFLFLRIPTRQFDGLGFVRRDSNSVKAWKIAVLTVLSESDLVDFKGFLEDQAGVGIVFLGCDHSLVERMRKAMLRNLSEADLLPQLRLKPAQPFFEAFVYYGKPEKEHLNAAQALARFNHVAEGFFTVQPLLYSDISLNRWNGRVVALVKRSIDIAGALLGVTLLSPVLLLLAMGVKWSDRKGPVFFKQVRVGLNGSHFWMYKFRSMYKDAEARLAEIRHLNETTGPVFKMKNDPRIFPFGRFIRKYSMDELPQLLNILKGDMSIVGPRPPIPEEVLEYLPWHKMRLAVKPGLTCHWQVSGRSNIGFEDWMRLDNKYVRHGDIGTDISLIGRTLKVVVKGDGAY